VCQFPRHHHFSGAIANVFIVAFFDKPVCTSFNPEAVAFYRRFIAYASARLSK
tara:strand:- start:12 stop:170 length:159 start_codon:yes stop_codon:yes gene_type:complete